LLQRNFLFEQKKCPLCSNLKYKYSHKTYKNRYSEDIARYLKTTEEEIFRNCYNVECTNCKIIYKKIWFKKKVLELFYKNVFPKHEKGWDSFTNGFSKRNFLRLINKIKLNNEKKNFNYLLRSIYSIVDSIKTESKIKYRYLNYLKNKDVLNVLRFYKKINSLINIPIDFKRYTGFNSLKLFNYINNKIKLDSYCEIGCPLWGMHKIATRKNIVNHHISLPEYAFWGIECKYKNFNCIQKCKVKKKISINKLNSQKKYDLISIFLAIDHVIDLEKLLKSIFRKSLNVLIVIEKFNKKGFIGNPIQHFTSFNDETMKFISKKFNKKLNKSLRELDNSGNKMYFFTNHD
jgi:hypothetical protein